MAWVNNLAAQGGLLLNRTGTNRVLIVNPEASSITIEVVGLRTLIVPGLGSAEISFPLNRANVEKRLFLTRYDQASFAQDSLLCRRQLISINTITENQLEMQQLVDLLLSRQLTKDHFSRMLIGMVPLTGITRQAMDSLLPQLLKVYSMSGNKDWQRQQLLTIIKSSFKQSVATSASTLGCVDNARHRLNTIQPDSFYASAFFSAAERSSIEISLLGVAGFKVSQFKQSGGRRAFQPVLYGIRPSYGIRLNYKFNAYDAYKVRNSGIQSYIPVSIFKSRAIYKKIPDSTFAKNQTRQWLFISAGFGQELNYKDESSGKRKAALLFDIGLVSGMVTTGILDSATGRIQQEKSEPGFAGIVPYIHIGYKRRLAQWLDIYASWYSTFMYKYLGYDTRNIPRFRQFNLGFNITLYRKVSYQY